MKMHFFSIPALDPGEAATGLQRFLDAHCVASLDKELVQAGHQSIWAVCVTTEAEAPGSLARAHSTNSSRKRVDDKEALSPEQFALYARLRALRKQLAEQEGVPPHACFNHGTPL